MNVCAATKRDGNHCKAVVNPSQEYCYAHDPTRAEERTRNARLAAKARHSRLGRELQQVRETLSALIWLTTGDRLSMPVRKELASIVQLVNAYLRATELQMRMTERPPEAAELLDGATLKEQVWERIEVLETREQEREEKLEELVHLATECGFDQALLRSAL